MRGARGAGGGSAGEIVGAKARAQWSEGAGADEQSASEVCRSNHADQNTLF